MCCLIETKLNLEIKSFVSLKNECLLFWMRVLLDDFKEGIKFSKILRGVAHKRRQGGGLTELEFLWGGGGARALVKRSEVNISVYRGN